MPANIGTEAIGVERCVSCDAPLSGPYCARCGERVLEPEALTLRHFLVYTVATSSCTSTARCAHAAATVRAARPALAGRGRLLSVAAAMLIYVANGVFMTAVQLGGAAVALALA